MCRRIMLLCFALLVVSGMAVKPPGGIREQKGERAKTPLPELHVRPTDDFEVTGEGSAAAWKKTEWVPLNKRSEDGLPYVTRVKILYSKKGVYALMDATDKKVTATLKDDFADLWTEDVFEVFLWPDE